jgi:hypothetical protein
VSAAANPFAQIVQRTQQFQQSQPIQQPAVNPFQTTSNTIQNVNPFGSQQQPQQTQNIFQTQQTPFFQAPQIQQSPPSFSQNVFSNTPAAANAFTNQIQQPNIFGNNPTAVNPNPNLFPQLNSQAQGFTNMSFTNSNQTQNAQINTSFGGSGFFNSASATFPNSTSGPVSSKPYFSDSNELSEQEMKEYRAEKFEIGRIPYNPPSREMI